jgi:hypothetical protein
MGYASVQKLPLKPNDGLGDPKDGSLALMNGLDQPEGRTNFFVDVFFGFSSGWNLLPEDIPVIRADAQLGQAILIEHHYVLLAHLINIHVWGNVRNVLVAKAPSGFGVEFAEEP